MEKEKLLTLVTNKAMTKGFESMTNVLPSAPGPLTFVGPGSTEQLCVHISELNVSKILVVTDKPLLELGVVAKATDVLKQKGVEVIVFDGVLPDPTLDLIEEGLAIQLKNSCDAILAIGGGSSIDTAKTIAAAATNGGKPQEVVGQDTVKNDPVLLFAIPTTSGTGSEATFGAVVSDPVTHEKFLIIDNKIIPKAVALDPDLITGLPPSITAATGMDALTHAIESWIGTWANPVSDAYAKQSIEMLFNHLPTAFADGKNIEAPLITPVLPSIPVSWVMYMPLLINWVPGTEHPMGGQMQWFYLKCYASQRKKLKTVWLSWLTCSPWVCPVILLVQKQIRLLKPLCNLTCHSVLVLLLKPLRIQMFLQLPREL